MNSRKKKTIIGRTGGVEGDPVVSQSFKDSKKRNSQRAERLKEARQAGRKASQSVKTAEDMTISLQLFRLPFYIII